MKYRYAVLIEVWLDFLYFRVTPCPVWTWLICSRWLRHCEVGRASELMSRKKIGRRKGPFLRPPKEGWGVKHSTEKLCNLCLKVSEFVPSPSTGDKLISFWGTGEILALQMEIGGQSWCQKFVLNLGVNWVKGVKSQMNSLDEGVCREAVWQGAKWREPVRSKNLPWGGV